MGAGTAYDFDDAGSQAFFCGNVFAQRAEIWYRVGLMELLDKVAARWKEQPDELVELGEQVLTEHERHDKLASYRGELDEHSLNKAFHQFSFAFDKDYGGFGEAPKFPSPHNLSFLLRYAQHTGNQQALEMAEKTLDAMYRGGIYDHVGMGFSRYAVDEKWLVPHFEKMLYDNALLVPLLIRRLGKSLARSCIDGLRNKSLHISQGT